MSYWTYNQEKTDTFGIFNAFTEFTLLIPSIMLNFGNTKVKLICGGEI